MVLDRNINPRIVSHRFPCDASIWCGNGMRLLSIGRIGRIGRIRRIHLEPLFERFNVTHATEWRSICGRLVMCFHENDTYDDDITSHTPFVCAQTQICYVWQTYFVVVKHNAICYYIYIDMTSHSHWPKTKYKETKTTANNSQPKNGKWSSNTLFRWTGYSGDCAWMAAAFINAGSSEGCHVADEK